MIETSWQDVLMASVYLVGYAAAMREARDIRVRRHRLNTGFWFCANMGLAVAEFTKELPLAAATSLAFAVLYAFLYLRRAPITKANEVISLTA